MASAIDQEFYNYFKQLDDAQKISMLQLLKSFLRADAQPFDNTNEEDYNRAIDTALTEAASGNYITQEEMEKRAAKW